MKYTRFSKNTVPVTDLAQGVPHHVPPGAHSKKARARTITAKRNGWIDTICKNISHPAVHTIRSECLVEGNPWGGDTAQQAQKMTPRRGADTPALSCYLEKAGHNQQTHVHPNTALGNCNHQGTALGERCTPLFNPPPRNPLLANALDSSKT